MRDPRAAAHPFHRDRTRDRAIQELLGFAKGIVADGVVTDAEAVGLAQWIAANPAATECWPGNVIGKRLCQIFEDGIIEDEDRESLCELLMRTVGERPGSDDAMVRSTSLPLTEPVPTLTFVGQLYVFTGTFYYGTRKRCEAVVSERGGTCGSDVTRATSVLVIGTLATEAWQFSTHGRKIEKAVQYRDDGSPIAIVSEESWVAALG